MTRVEFKLPCGGASPASVKVDGVELAGAITSITIKAVGRDAPHVVLELGPCDVEGDVEALLSKIPTEVVE